MYVPYSQNQFLALDFFCKFLQQDGSSLKNYTAAFGVNVLILEVFAIFHQVMTKIYETKINLWLPLKADQKPTNRPKKGEAMKWWKGKKKRGEKIGYALDTPLESRILFVMVSAVCII